jgi:hypothetical protein
MFTSSGVTLNNDPDLSYWRIFEMYLTSGEHIISMEGYNYQDEASFGAEIYSATTAQLTGMTSESQLSAVTIFTTADYRTDVVSGTSGTQLFDLVDDEAGSKCPAGWIFAPVGECYATGTCVNLLTSGLTHDITATTTSTTVCISTTTTACTEICLIKKVPICVNPLDYLDIVPSEITVKEVFDEAILRSLIDVKSRQTISGYPMLQLFYQLYLNASNCGKDLTGRLDYNNLFEFMDKIGDYWLDLIEQVVPATTIWEGCDNSGKIYRNTIFDQDKYAYKRYALNYVCLEDCAPPLDPCDIIDSRIHGETKSTLELVKEASKIKISNACCHLSAYTSNSIGSQTVDVEVEIITQYPSNEETARIIKEINELEIHIRETEAHIIILQTKVCALQSHDPLPAEGNTIEELIESINTQISKLMDSLAEDKERLITLNKDLLAAQEELAEQQATFKTNNECCSPISTRLKTAQDNLINNFVEGTVMYERQEKFIEGLKNEYKKCIDRYNNTITKCNTVFITQIYDSNEYEGNVGVSGDKEWYSSGGFEIGAFQDASTYQHLSQKDLKKIPGKYYNTELIHDCDPRSKEQISNVIEVAYNLKDIS